ncbi:MAG: hypothetical protein FWD72_02090, partial [Eggerthellaceae bacterium]|nr:hypothetical protein [Eggerthellaceae bacterium]
FRAAVHLSGEDEQLGRHQEVTAERRTAWQRAIGRALPPVFSVMKKVKQPEPVAMGCFSFYTARR